MRIAKARPLSGTEELLVPQPTLGHGLGRTDGGVALVAARAAAAERHAVQQAHVVAHHGRLADHDARRVVHQDATPDSTHAAGLPLI